MSPKMRAWMNEGGGRQKKTDLRALLESSPQDLVLDRIKGVKKGEASTKVSDSSNSADTKSHSLMRYIYLCLLLVVTLGVFDCHYSIWDLWLQHANS